MMVYAIALAIFVLVPIAWVCLKLAPWSAPLAFVGGFATFVIGVHSDSPRMMGFGGGLCAFCALVWLAGGGWDNR